MSETSQHHHHTLFFFIATILTIMFGLLIMAIFVLPKNNPLVIHPQPTATPEPTQQPGT